MATIELNDQLSPSTKAKLQDAELLYEADVIHQIRCAKEAPGKKRPEDVESLGAILKSRLARCESEEEQAEHHAPSPGEGSRHCPPLCTPSDKKHSASIYRTATLDSRQGTLNLTDLEVEEVVRMVRRSWDEKESKAPSTNSASEKTTVSAESFSNPTPPSSSPRSRGLCFEPHTRIPGCVTLHDLAAELQALEAQGIPTHVTTFSQALDELLGGGVPVGGVTEISGPPGVGKTQLLMQLAVSCAMPTSFGGLDGSCLFVDTEGSFVVERLEQMATAAVSLVRSIHQRHRLASEGKIISQAEPVEKAKNPLARAERPRNGLVDKRQRSPPSSDQSWPHDIDLKQSGPVQDPKEAKSHQGGLVSSLAVQATEEGFTVEKVLQRVRYVRITDLPELLALLHSLPLYLEGEGLSDMGSQLRSNGPDRAPTHLSRSAAAFHSGVDSAPLRMLLIDSIALPFRTTGSFQKNGFGSESLTVSASVRTSSMGDAHGAIQSTVSTGPLSKHGLWQRSRLLFHCSMLLEDIAAAFRLTVLVTNHMTTKTLRAAPIASASSSGGGMSTLPRGPEALGSSPTWSTVLVPALGDAWVHGLSTRLLLSFHHYEPQACGVAPIASSTDRHVECQEDVVYGLLAREQQPKDAAGDATSMPSTALQSVVQHRVARILKCSGQPRREACFLVTSKGIRDVQKDMVAKRLALTMNT